MTFLDLILPGHQTKAILIVFKSDKLVDKKLAINNNDGLHMTHFALFLPKVKRNRGHLCAGAFLNTNAYDLLLVVRNYITYANSVSTLLHNIVLITTLPYIISHKIFETVNKTSSKIIQ